MAPEMVPELWDKVAEWGHPCPMDTFLVSPTNTTVSSAMMNDW